MPDDHRDRRPPHRDYAAERPSRQMPPVRKEAVPQAVSNEDSVPIDAPQPEVVKQIARQTKNSVSELQQLNRRQDALEAQLVEMRIDQIEIKSDIKAQSDKITFILEETAASRQTRLDREKLHMSYADANSERRLKTWLAVCAIVVPTIAAIGAIIATLAK